MYELGPELAVETVPESVAREFVTSVLRALGATPEEASINADGLITAALWWHPGQGQGLEKLFRYARRMRNGGIVGGATMKWSAERTSTAILDAGKGLGYVAASRAMDKAIAKATSSGIAMVAVQHSNHFGIAGYHAKRAADAGVIGIAMTNAGAEMAPWGSAKPVLGTNPWGLAVPRGASADPIVLDMALTQSGKGMMRWFKREGLPIPGNWALTPAGERTTDPVLANDGPLLPMGDYKGYGLSLFTDIITGVLSGSLFGLDVFQDDQNFDVSHAMIAIDIEAFMPRDQFNARLEQLVSDVLAAPPIDPDKPIRLPGQAEQQRARERRTAGIPIDRFTVDGLEELASELGLTCSLRPNSN